MNHLEVQKRLARSKFQAGLSLLILQQTQERLEALKIRMASKK